MEVEESGMRGKEKYEDQFERVENRGEEDHASGRA